MFPFRFRVRLWFVVGVLFIFWALFWFFMNIMSGQPFRYEQVVLAAFGAALMVLFWPRGMTIDQFVGLVLILLVGSIVVPILLGALLEITVAFLCIAAGFLLWLGWMWLRWRFRRRE